MSQLRYSIQKQSIYPHFELVAELRVDKFGEGELFVSEINVRILKIKRDQNNKAQLWNDFDANTPYYRRKYFPDKRAVE